MDLVGAMRVILLALLLSSCTLHPGERPGTEVGAVDLCHGTVLDGAACGGDLNGTWTLEGACLGDLAPLLNRGSGPCHDTAVLSADLVNATGEWWFNAAGRGSQRLETSLDVTTIFTPACVEFLADLGEPDYAVCSRIGEGSELGDVGDCELIDARCVCDDRIDTSTFREMSWSRSLSSVSVDFDDGGITDFDYCVDADLLHLEAGNGLAYAARH